MSPLRERIDLVKPHYYRADGVYKVMWGCWRITALTCEKAKLNYEYWIEHGK